MDTTTLLLFSLKFYHSEAVEKTLILFKGMSQILGLANTKRDKYASFFS
jgi:hypothetical protein